MGAAPSARREAIWGAANVMLAHCCRPTVPPIPPREEVMHRKAQARKVSAASTATSVSALLYNLGRESRRGGVMFLLDFAVIFEIRLDAGQSTLLHTCRFSVYRV